VTWDIAFDGDSPIFRHDVVCTEVVGLDTGSISVLGALTNQATVGPLLAGNFSCTVSAVNAVGPSVPAVSDYTVTSFGAPTTPTNVVASPLGRAVSVTFTGPSDDGITGFGNLTYFILRSYPALDEVGLVVPYAQAGCTPALAANASCGPITFPGFTEGVQYQITVEARNIVPLNSGPSIPSNIVIPLPVVPGMPFTASATEGRRSASVSWQPPMDDGGSPVLYYLVTSNPGQRQARTVDGNTTSATVTGLTANVVYDFTVVAFNMIGQGTGTTSNSITAQPDVPAAPEGLTVSPGDAEVTITFLVPDNGGLPITTYTAIVVNDTLTFTVNAVAAATKQSVKAIGLTNGQTYRFQVYATNPVGDGPPSALSPYATPDKKSNFQTWALAVGLVLLILAIIVGVIVLIYYLKENDKACWAKGSEGGKSEPSGAMSQQELTSKGAGGASDQPSPKPGAVTSAPSSSYVSEPQRSDEEAPVEKHIGGEY